MRRSSARAFFSVLTLLPVGCGGAPPAPAPSPAARTARPVEDLVVHVVRSYPHDAQAFTQGLLYSEGRIYESTGLEGRSSVRKVELETGHVEQKTEVPPAFFGEGLARVGDHLVQLTWQHQRAFVYSFATFEKTGEYTYDGEGWGLCFDGQRLVMSDGSDRLVFRDPANFGPLGAVRVSRNGAPVQSLNELECVGKEVYANVWQTDSIARIDVATGQVTGWIDAAGLLTRDERARTDVLNGIAWLPDRKTFLITGKLWPRVFEVTFAPRAASGPR